MFGRLLCITVCGLSNAMFVCRVLLCPALACSVACCVGLPTKNEGGTKSFYGRSWVRTEAQSNIYSHRGRKNNNDFIYYLKGSKLTVRGLGHRLMEDCYTDLFLTTLWVYIHGLTSLLLWWEVLSRSQLPPLFWALAYCSLQIWPTWLSFWLIVLSVGICVYIIS